MNRRDPRPAARRRRWCCARKWRSTWRKGWLPQEFFDTCASLAVMLPSVGESISECMIGAAESAVALQNYWTGDDKP